VEAAGVRAAVRERDAVEEVVPFADAEVAGVGAAEVGSGVSTATVAGALAGSAVTIAGRSRAAGLGADVADAAKATAVITPRSTRAVSMSLVMRRIGSRVPHRSWSVPCILARARECRMSTR